MQLDLFATINPGPLKEQIDDELFIGPPGGALLKAESFCAVLESEGWPYVAAMRRAMAAYGLGGASRDPEHVCRVCIAGRIDEVAQSRTDLVDDGE